MRRVGDGAARILRMPLILQFVKFGVVGVSNTLISFAVYTLLLKAFGVWYVAASGIGFAVGAINGFLWNRAWTFRGHVGDALTPVRWFAVQSCGLLVNLGLVYLFVDGFGLGKLTRPGSDDRDRYRAHLLCQPGLDLQRDRRADPGRGSRLLAGLGRLFCSIVKLSDGGEVRRRYSSEPRLPNGIPPAATVQPGSSRRDRSRRPQDSVAGAKPSSEAPGAPTGRGSTWWSTA